VRQDFANEIGAAAGKAALPLGVAAAGISGWGLQEWVYAVTFVYVTAQLGYLLWKWHREWKSGKRRRG